MRLSAPFLRTVRGTLFSALLVFAATAAQAEVNRAQLAIFQQLPAAMESSANPLTEAKIDLGRQLYYDPRLSKNQDISCNSCHLLDAYGQDNLPVSPGHRGQTGGRSSPPSYNAAGHIAQFWDGRAPTVEEQAKGPVLNPIEMAMPDEASVIAVLKSIPGYVTAFGEAFPGEADPVTYNNMALAIGAFERKLVTPGRFDQYLAGNDDALTAEEKAGLEAFLNTGCQTCHMGPYIGGAMYQKLGLVKPWEDTSDLGRFEATGNEFDKMFFKVPSLRNIAETGPYFHKGQVATLDEAVSLMAEYQLGRTLDDATVKSIVTFLGALTGEIPVSYIAEPELPASSESTPKPDPS